MKNYILLAIFFIALTSCKDEPKRTVESPAKEITQVTYKSFGKEIVADDAISATSMFSHYTEMNTGDSINAKVTANVKEVCQAKGCWMKLSLDNGDLMMVKFKDYGFFMPKNIAGKEVIINGKAFVKEVSVEEQRHYAEDGGESKEAIATITEPKKTYSFEADGVLLKE